MEMHLNNRIANQNRVNRETSGNIYILIIVIIQLQCGIGAIVCQVIV